MILGQGGTVWQPDASPPDARRLADDRRSTRRSSPPGRPGSARGSSSSTTRAPNGPARARSSPTSTSPTGSSPAGTRTGRAPLPDRRPRRRGPTAPGRAGRPDGRPGRPAGGRGVGLVDDPRDAGPAGTVGFFARSTARPMPRSPDPAARRRGGRVRMHLRDLGLAAGRVGPPGRPGRRRGGERRPGRRGRGDGSPADAPTPLAGRRPQPVRRRRRRCPRLRGAEVAIIDELDKVQPVTRHDRSPRSPTATSPPTTSGAPASGRIRLHAARNEFVGVPGPDPRRPRIDRRPSLTFARPAGSKLRVEFGRYRPGPARSGPLPDPIVPLDVAGRRPSPGRTSQSLHAEVYVPHDAAAGDHAGTLTLKSGGQTLALGVTLAGLGLHPARPPELPARDELLRPAGERARLLPAGPPAPDGPEPRALLPERRESHDGCAPKWDGKTLDWSAWDRRFGPLLDGSAFADLPRKGVPVECFYLPLHENWPTPMEGNYNGDYWADRAFPEPIAAPSSRSSRQFAEHCQRQGLERHALPVLPQRQDRLQAQGLVARLVPLAARRAGQLPGLLGPPLLRRGLPRGGQPGHRARPSSSSAATSPGPSGSATSSTACSTTTSSAARCGTIAGSSSTARRPRARSSSSTAAANAIEDSNIQPVGWCLDAWSLGLRRRPPLADDRPAESWTKADALSLFYPARRRRRADPLDPPQGLPPRPAGRRVPDALRTRPASRAGPSAGGSASGCNWPASADERDGRGRRRGTHPVQGSAPPTTGPSASGSARPLTPAPHRNGNSSTSARLPETQRTSPGRSETGQH